MIVCTKCAFQNLDDDAFCGSCGSFLEWSGESVVPEVREDAAESVAAKRSLLSRVQTVLSLDIHAPGENPVVAEPAAPGAAPGGPPRPGGPTAPGGPPRPGGPTPPGGPGGPTPPTRPGGAPTPPTRPGGAPTPPARPGAAPTPPTRPGGDAPTPPTRPGGDAPTPPTRPGGVAPTPPTRPGGDAPTPPTRPGGAAPTPPARPAGDAPSPPSRPATVAQATAEPVAPSIDPALLVAKGAIDAQPEPAPPRIVAKKEVSTGERVIGRSDAAADEATAAVSPGATEAVKPQRATDRPKPVKQKPTRKILPGDLICGECGEGNPPARKFCSRCGTPLSSAQVAKIAWWRKLIPHRRRKAMDAGARPWKAADGKQKKRRGIGAFFAAAFVKLRPVIAIALLLGGLLYGFSPDLREKANSTIGDAKDTVMSKIQKTYGPIAPIDVAANSATEESPVTNVVDSNTITSWIAPDIDPEPTMVVRFDEPIDLARVKIWNGAAVGFKEHARVSNIHFVFDTGQSFDLAIDDLPDGKDYEIENAGGVSEVEVHIVGTHSSLQSTDVGLSEIEFLVQR